LKNTPPPRDEIFRIGYIGQIAPHKGVHLLLAAFKKLHSDGRPLELHIFGGYKPQAGYARSLLRMASEDSRIHFHGRFENRYAPEILSRFDVSVVPSIWHEIGPLTILESFAAGTPVLASPLGNMVDLIQDGHNGLYFQPNSPDDLALKLQKLVDDPSLLEKLRSGVRLPRSQDEEMAQVTAIYDQALARHSTSTEHLSNVHTC